MIFYVPRTNSDYPNVLRTTKLEMFSSMNEHSAHKPIFMANAQGSFDRLSGFNHRSGGLNFVVNVTVVKSA